MKLQQLRYICEVAHRGLNLSDAAAHLHTSQPGISQQIRLLEEELGVEIFVRHGRRLIEITEPGKAVLSIAERMLLDSRNLKRVGEEYSNETTGSLSIATTHTQARYALPSVIKRFTQRHPKVRLSLYQGSPTQIAQQVASGEADIAIATEAIELRDDLIMLPCYQWNHCVITPLRHPLLHESHLTIEAVARYPIITYDFAFTGRSKINKAFELRGLKPNVVLTAIDADVIKTYTEIGVGIGIMAKMAFDPHKDKKLRVIDAAHLFESNTTRIGIRRGDYLRRYIYDFIELFAPQLTRSAVDSVLQGRGSVYEL